MLLKLCNIDLKKNLKWYPFCLNKISIYLNLIMLVAFKISQISKRQQWPLIYSPEAELIQVSLSSKLSSGIQWCSIGNVAQSKTNPAFKHMSCIWTNTGAYLYKCTHPGLTQNPEEMEQSCHKTLRRTEWGVVTCKLELFSKGKPQKNSTLCIFLGCALSLNTLVSREKPFSLHWLQYISICSCWVWLSVVALTSLELQSQHFLSLPNYIIHC